MGTLPQQIKCRKCGRLLIPDNFYLSHREDRYPSGRLDVCKKCITMHLDNWDPKTYLWILKEIDVPYVPSEWYDLLSAYEKDNKAVTSLTILGRYLSKMRLKQYRDYRYSDTEAIQDIQDAKTRESMEARGFSTGDIEKAIYKNRGFLSLVKDEEGLEQPQQEELNLENYVLQVPQKQERPEEPERYGYGMRFQSDADDALPIEDYFAKQAESSTDTIGDELTDEDRTYLRLKWGKSYRPDEWVRLEQLYQEMKESYDIQGAAHEDNLKLLCKTSLKANQLIDAQDIEGFQKMSKVYDQLLKAGNFAASQNKVEEGDFIDSIAELVELCEKEGFIPRYYISEPNDMVDATIEDMKRYTHSLITEETNLGNLIESAIKQFQYENEGDENSDDSQGGMSEVEEVEHELKSGRDYTNYLTEDTAEMSDEELAALLESGEI